MYYVIHGRRTVLLLVLLLVIGVTFWFGFAQILEIHLMI